MTLSKVDPAHVERVADVFKAFQEHESVTSGFYIAHRALIAAALTTAYFAGQTTVVNNDQRPKSATKAAKKR